MNILCKLRLHKWDKITFNQDKPFITRECGRCNKVEEITFWMLSSYDRLDYLFWFYGILDEKVKQIVFRR